MNRIQNVSNRDPGSNNFDSIRGYTEENRLQWIQSICEQLGDGYLVFSRWQCIGLGGVLWRESGSSSLYQPKDDNWLSVFHEDDHGIVALGLADPAANSFPPVRIRNRHTGEIRPARMRVFYPPFESAEGIFVVVLQLDPTPFHIVKPSEQTDLNHHCNIFEAASAEMLVVQLGSGLIERVNSAFLRENRIDRSEVIGTSFFNLRLIDPEVARVLLGTVELGGTIKRRPVVLSSPNGKQREMLIDVSKISEVGDQVVIHFSDVTVQNSATRHLSSILNHLPIGIFTKDAGEGTYLLSNVAADAFLANGTPLRGQHDADLFPEQTAAIFDKLDAETIREEKPVETSEVNLPSRNGERRLFDILRVPVTDGCGRITRILGMIRDVTEDVRVRENLKQAKDLADRANRAKDEFLVNMGHEIRTPMNAILGFSTLLAETGLTEEQFELNQEVYTSGENLSALIDSILDLSRIAGGALEIEYQELNLSEFCTELVELHRPEATRKSLDLSLEFDPKIPHRVFGDPLRLRQIIKNILENAIKFTNSGSVELRVASLELTATRSQIQFSVLDTGIGIDPTMQSMIFEPFVQADSSETRAYEGTGLGLTLSQRLAEAMGGSIELVSERGFGSTFSFTLWFDHDGQSELSGDEIPPPEGVLRILAKTLHLGKNIALPVMKWGLETQVVECLDDLCEVGEAEADNVYTFVEWIALDPTERIRLREILESVEKPNHWLLVIPDTIEGDALSARFPGVQILHSNPRTTHLRAALIDANREAAGENDHEMNDPAESSLAREPRPAVSDFSELRILVIDDNGKHRRELTGLLQKFEVTVDTCGNEHDAAVLVRVHVYDVIFFESSFVGADTPCMIRTLSRAIKKEDAPVLIGLAFTPNPGRERALAEVGVRCFVRKPVDEETLRQCLLRVQSRNVTSVRP